MIRALLALTACALAACGDRRGELGRASGDVAVPLPGSNAEEWRAWSASDDGSLVVAAADFDVPGAVALIDTRLRRVELLADAVLVRAERPVLWRLSDGRYWDVVARTGFVVPADALSDPRARVHLSSNGKGGLARLARSEQGRKLELHAWASEGAPSWSQQILPVPDGAGVAVSPTGDTVALVRVQDRAAPVQVTLLDMKTGRTRWQVFTDLHAAMPDAVNELVQFSDDGSRVFVHGSEGERDQVTFQGLGTAKGEVQIKFHTAGTLAYASDTLLGVGPRAAWFGKVSYSAGVGHPLGPIGGVRPEAWRCELQEVGLSSPAATLDTVLHDAEYARFFGRRAGSNCTTHAILRIAGGFMFVRPEHDRVRLVTYLPTRSRR